MLQTVTKNELNSLIEFLLSKIITHGELTIVERDFQKVTEFLQLNNFQDIILDLEYTDLEKATKIGKKLERCSLASPVLKETLLEIIDRQFLILLTSTNWRNFQVNFFNQVKIQGTVNLTTAIELKQTDLARLHYLIAQKYGKYYFLEVKVKPNIIAGFILEKDAEIYDASIESSLETYRQQWVKQMSGDIV